MEGAGAAADSIKIAAVMISHESGAMLKAAVSQKQGRGVQAAVVRFKPGSVAYKGETFHS